MMKLSILTLAFLLASVGHAATPMPTTEQVCEAAATEKQLSGAEHSRYVEACLQTMAVADMAEQCEAAADDAQLDGAEKTRYVETCVQLLRTADMAEQCEAAAAEQQLADDAFANFVSDCMERKRQ